MRIRKFSEKIPSPQNPPARKIRKIRGALPDSEWRRVFCHSGIIS